MHLRKISRRVHTQRKIRIHRMGSFLPFSALQRIVSALRVQERGTRLVPLAASQFTTTSQPAAPFVWWGWMGALRPGLVQSSTVRAKLDRLLSTLTPPNDRDIEVGFRTQ